ncbi:MAG: TonB-dependent receptor [Muribaculaceae bacterium]|nr:TonB-dependent receptor [Muribaculaceae bacterium]
MENITRRFILSFTLLLLLSAAGAAASPFKVIGEVADSTGEPEIYATVRVYAAADSLKPVSLGVTDDMGRFSQGLPKAGGYRLTVTSVGKQPVDLPFEVSASSPVRDFGKLTVGENKNELAEVEVVAQRPLVTREIDRIGYDVKADPESQTNTLQEMLRKVPLVTVEADGTIKVKGSTNFKIYKNGRPNNSFTKNAKDIFAAIPASSIKKIEVITDPGAREDAEGVGAILNIVTDSEASLRGVTGNASIFLDNNNLEPLPNLYLTSQIDKVTFSVYGGESCSNRKESRQRMEQRDIYYETGNSLYSYGESESVNRSGWGGIEASWEPDTLNLLTLEAQGWLWNRSDYSGSGHTALFGPDGTELYSYSRRNLDPAANYFDFDGSANYQRSTRRKGETITLSYRLSTTRQHSDALTEYYDKVNCDFLYSAIGNNTRQTFFEHTGQADWSRPFGDRHKLDVGAKAIFRRNHSTNFQEYRDVASYETDFTHHTTVAAIYGDYRVTLGKWNLRAGMRYEYSYLSARFLRQGNGDHPDFSSKLNDWVPSAGVSYNLTDAITLKASYNRNIRRPGISYLDPARSVTPTTVSYGNPDLESEVYNNVSAEMSMYTNKFNLSFYLGGTIVNNALCENKWVADDITYSTYGNIGKVRSFTSWLYFQWTIGPKTSLMCNLSTGYNHFSNPDMSRGGWWWNPYLRAVQKLPWKLELTGSGYYWSGSVNSPYNQFKPTGDSGIGYNLSLTRRFLKEDRLTVTLGANNFASSKHNTFASHTWTPSSYSEYLSIGSDTRRSFSLRVSYRFGSLNTSVKKTAASINNDDLQGRKKN